MAGNAKPRGAAAVAIVEEKAKEVSEERMAEKATKAKNVAGLLSITTFVLSLPILASVIWLLYMKDSDCEYLLRLPKLRMEIGIGMIVVFLVSNLVVFLGSRLPVAGFFLVMTALILLLTVGLSLAGANKLESRTIIATPMWFREKVHDDNKWKDIKSCIYNAEICDDLASRFLTLKSYDFSVKKLSFVEYGCCKPPAICGMEYVNATFWRRADGNGTVDGSHPYVRDCDIWQNNPEVLCYDCEPCKIGFVRTLESKWWKLGVFFILMGTLLITSHLLLFIALMLQRYNG